MKPHISRALTSPGLGSNQIRFAALLGHREIPPHGILTDDPWIWAPGLRFSNNFVFHERAVERGVIGDHHISFNGRSWHRSADLTYVCSISIWLVGLITFPPHSTARCSLPPSFTGSSPISNAD